MEVIGIVRVSSDRQAGEMVNGEREGLERQRVAVRKIAADLGGDLILVEIIGSGIKVADSVEWNTKVLPLLDGHRVLACMDFDRIIRADSFDYRSLAAIYASKTTVYTPAGKYNFDKPEDQFMASIMAAMGGLERSKIRQRTLSGRQAKKDAGLWTNGADPRGLSWDKMARRWSETEDADKVRQAFTMYAAGANLAKVASALGMTIVGASWLLRNKNYLRPDVPRLVDDATWATVQQRLADSSSRNKASRTVNKSNLVYGKYLYVDTPLPSGWLTFDVVDEPEGKRHVVYGVNNNGCFYYRCRCNLDKTMCRCGWKNIPAERVEPVVDAFLVRMTADPMFATVAVAALAEARGDTTADRRASLETALDALKGKKRRQAKAYTDGLMDEDLFYAEQRKTVADIAKLEAQLADLPTVKAVSATGDDVADLVSSWAFPASGSTADRIAWVQRFVREITVKPDGKTIRVTGASIKVPLRAGGFAFFALGESAALQFMGS
ncbi:MAG: recombinase family protein [Deltaproteobacteria bacterium]|nr:recombinase family protein [Deltaproteobacteria bacterium]